MKKTLKVGQIIGAYMVFTSPKYSKADMDINVAMWFMRNGREFETVRDIFEVKRKALFDAIAIEDKKKSKSVPKDKMPEYEAEIIKVIEDEVEVEVCMMSLQALQDFVITPSDLSAIEIAIEG